MRHHILLLGCVAFLLLSSFAISASAGSHSSASEAIEMVPVIIKLRHSLPMDSVSWNKGILGAGNSGPSSDIISEIRESGGSVSHRYRMLPALYARIPRSLLDKLSSNPAVEKVFISRTYRVFRSNATPLVRADSAWLNFSVNGSGINISIIDTGVFNHTEFRSPDRIIREKCFCSVSDNGNGGCCPPDYYNESGNATDDNDHGTHVAGIAAGEGGLGHGYGVAKGANIFAVKACNASGWCSDSDIIKAIEWSIENGANVISMSLGGPVTNDCYEDALPTWVDNATEHGVLVVAAAGNCGSGGNGCIGSGHGTIESPGCAKTALTVGATDNNDTLAYFSSMGPTKDNRTKPDIVAPGEGIDSTVLNNGYSVKSGTSMATPFVSGAAALLMQRYLLDFGTLPEPAFVKAVLMASANVSGMNSAGFFQRNNDYGSGRLDAYEALSIMNHTINRTISQSETHRFVLNSTGTVKLLLYWQENETFSNDLDLLVDNGTVHFNPTDASDSVEEVILYANQGVAGVSVNGTLVASSQKYFLSSSVPLYEDTSPPLWSSMQNATPQEYNGSQESVFYVNWSDDFAVGQVLLEANWSGSAENYTMSYENGSYVFRAVLPAGSFYWRSHARDMSMNWNSSPIREFSIHKAGTLLFLYANGTPGNATAVYGNVTNVTGFKNHPEGSLSLYLNGSPVSNPHAEKLSAGYWNYTLIFPGSQNHSSNQTSLFLLVEKADPGMTLLLNGQESDNTVNQSDAVNMTVYAPSGGNVSLYVDGSLYAYGPPPIENISSFLPGVYNVTSYYSGSQNYTASSATLWLTVNDTEYPQITGASLFPPLLLAGEGVGVSALVSDPNLDSVWYVVSNSSWNESVYLGNQSSVNSSYPTAGLAPGNYSITLRANDSSGNAASLHIGEFLISPPSEPVITLSDPEGNPLNATSIAILYPGTGVPRNQSGGSPNLSVSLPSGEWDVFIQAEGLNLTLGSVNLSGSVSLNITVNGSVALSEIPGAYPIKTVSAESSSNFSLASLSFGYDDSLFIRESRAALFACHSWNSSLSSCSGSWENITGSGDINVSSNTVTLNTSSLSAFSLAETYSCGDSIIDEGEQCDGQNLGGSTCSSLGYAGGSLSCSSCSLDVSGCISFSGGGSYSLPASPGPVILEAGHLSLLAGTAGNATLKLRNAGSTALNISLNASTNCSGCLLSNSMEVSLSPGEEKTLSFTVNVPQSQQPGEYYINYQVLYRGDALNSTSSALRVYSCVPGTLSCREKSLYECDGDGWNFVEECEGVCVAGRCKSLGTSRTLNDTPVCIPKDKNCSGGMLYSCRPDGSGWEEEGSCNGNLLLLPDYAIKYIIRVLLFLLRLIPIYLFPV